MRLDIPQSLLEFGPNPVNREHWMDDDDIDHKNWHGELSNSRTQPKKRLCPDCEPLGVDNQIAYKKNLPFPSEDLQVYVCPSCMKRWKEDWISEGNSGRFEKGHVPFNKGKPHPYGKETEFKSGPGHTGDKHPTWGGGEQKMARDCTYVWSGTNQRIRRPHKVWTDKHGPIPAGMVLYHKDGDRYNDDLDNLELISRGELARRNRRDRVAKGKISEAEVPMPSSKELIDVYDDVLRELRSALNKVHNVRLPRRGSDIAVEEERTSLDHLFALTVRAVNQAEYLFNKHKKLLLKQGEF